MKELIGFIIAVVFVSSGCTDATTRLLQREGYSLRREVTDVAAEKIEILKGDESGERILLQGLREFTDPEMRKAVEERLLSFRENRNKRLELLDSYAAALSPVDRILFVHSTNSAETCYLFVRNGVILRRGGIVSYTE